MVKKDEAFITFLDSFIIYNFLCYMIFISAVCN